jgi:hypothetical protein
VELIQEVIAKCVDDIKAIEVRCTALLKYRLLKGIEVPMHG